jgi:hypothetical protein
MKRFIPLTILALFLAVGVGCDNNEEDSIDGDSSVTGTIISSQTGDGLADALVTLARGDASRDDLTDSTGTFTIDGIATGPYTVTISAAEFVDRVITGFEVGEGVNELPRNLSIIAETPPEGAFRIVLSWGESPSDLDSHLTGPDGDEDRFHVLWSDMNPVDFASLDLDERDGEGPETITLTPENDGVYRYSVHNYSDQSEIGSQGLAGEIANSSPALVQVYTESELIREYAAPESTPGNTWRIFEMTVDGDDVSFDDINEYVSAENDEDINTFRMARK